MVTLRPKEYMMKYSDTRTAADAFYTDVRPFFETEEKVALNMEGTALSTIFLNSSFWLLMEEFGLERVKRKFVFHEITRSQADLLKKYFTSYQEIG